MNPFRSKNLKNSAGLPDANWTSNGMEDQEKKESTEGQAQSPDGPQPAGEMPAEPDEDTSDELSEAGEASQKSSQPAKKPAHHRWLDWYKTHKKWSIPASALALILLLALIPWSRYYVAGLVLEKNFSLQVVDGETNSPVSGATVASSGQSAETDGSGKAKLHLSVGHHALSITKKYYQDRRADVLVPVLREKSAPAIAFVATGRQVKITVTNLINHKALAGVDIKVAGTSAKTGSEGTTMVVLPVGVSTQKASLSSSGYNDAQVSVKVSDQTVQENNYALTPAGSIYFLSKLSGKIDVVKTDLDGKNRQTVVAGTGKEDDSGTVLLASRDWKYLALLARRDSDLPKLYLIDTSDDRLSTIDEGDANFTLVGWSDDNFVYQVDRTNYQAWQANKQALKSFDANNRNIILLDQTTASGTSQYDYVRENFGPTYADDNQVVYIKNWNSAYYPTAMAQLTTKQATFNSIRPDGSGKRTIRSFGVAPGTQTSSIFVEERIENPVSTYLKFSDGAAEHFYEYSGGQVKDNSNLTAESFYRANYPTYLLSPSSKLTFWSESRDGKNTLQVGDQNGQNAKQAATLSNYNPYGWFTENYLLVSKNSSELYILPLAGIKDDTAAIKISDYHKPAQTYPGYGGGYGGI